MATKRHANTTGAIKHGAKAGKRKPRNLGKLGAATTKQWKSKRAMLLERKPLLHVLYPQGKTSVIIDADELEVVPPLSTALVGRRGLRELRIVRHPQMERIPAELWQQCPSLESLQLHHCPQVRRVGAAFRCPNLEALHLFDCGIEDLGEGQDSASSSSEEEEGADSATVSEAPPTARSRAASTINIDDIVVSDDDISLSDSDADTLWSDSDSNDERKRSAGSLKTPKSSASRRSSRRSRKASRASVLSHKSKASRKSKPGSRRSSRRSASAASGLQGSKGGSANELLSPGSQRIVATGSVADLREEADDGSAAAGAAQGGTADSTDGKGEEGSATSAGEPGQGGVDDAGVAESKGPVDVGSDQAPGAGESPPGLSGVEEDGGGDDGDSSTAVPPWQCHKLQVLNVAQNALGRLPDAICELRKLRVLWANGNRISSLPESFGVLQCLTHLDLSENKLEVLPESVAHLHNLRELRLNDNQLGSLPTDLGHVTSLQTLDMSSNCISALPESFGGLASLRSLDASHNVLETLPSSIGRCTALVTLDLTHNKLWELPTEVLATMTQLTNLELRHNKLYGHRTDTYNEDAMKMDALRVTDDAPAAESAFAHAAHTALAQMGDLFNTAHERSLRPQRGTPEKAPNIADIVDEVGVPGASFGTTLQDFEESKRIRDTAAAEVAATEGLGLEEGVSIEDYLKNLGVTVSSRRPGSSVAGGGHAEAAKTHTAPVIPPPEPLPVSPRLPPPPLPPSSDEETDVRR